VAVVTLSPEPIAELSASDALSVKRLQEFVAGHPGNGTAVINYLGRPGARIVVVADDGAFGDAVVSGVVAAAEVCRRAGIPIAEGWDRELSAKITPSSADRRRMAGTGR
jgi:hypothetical protein